MKRKWIALVAVAALALCGCEAKESAVSAPELLEPVGVRADRAEAVVGPIDVTTVLDASVVPAAEDLYFEIDGVVDEINVVPGQAVNAGDVLVTLSEEHAQEAYDALAGEYDRRIEARRLRASFDGTVTYARKIDEGARSRLNERVVVVADSTLSLFRGETEWWSYFHEGDEYVITSNNREYHAVVTGEETLGLSPTEHVEGEKGSVYLALTEPAFDLDDGSRGTLILTRDSRTNVLMIPEDAVTLANGEPIVYYQNEEGVKAYKSIVIGLVAGDRVEVVDGLSEGDSVIVG